MLKVGLIGFGGMGRIHLESYKRLESEGFPIRLVAICDGQMEELKKKLDLSEYHLFSDMNEMMDQEILDYVDITLPTYLHASSTINALKRGFHVLCEKPMALNTAECMEMIETASNCSKQLMIGQCLRFWPAYEYLKSYVESQTFGKTLSAFFSRETGLPSLNTWFTQKEKSGGAMLDLHIHDVDMIQWLYGEPISVSTMARNIFTGSGYDVISSHFTYEDPMIIHAQADWTLLGDYGFDMSFRVNFEHGNLNFEKGILKVNPNKETGYIPELSKDTGYYREIKYFAEALANKNPIVKATPMSTLESVGIIEASVLSADQQGRAVRIK